MSDRLETIVSRRISDLLRGLSLEEPVVALHGPRSVGKSTVLRSYCREAKGELLDLDDINVLEAVRGNLSATAKAGTPLCVDEYQKLPAILDAIKARLNEEGSQPGTAVVTGSTRHDALPQTAQALTGRIHPITIWPLSQGEIAGVREDLLECLWENPEDAVQSVLTLGYVALGIRGACLRRGNATGIAAVSLGAWPLVRRFRAHQCGAGCD